MCHPPIRISQKILSINDEIDKLRHVGDSSVDGAAGRDR